MKHGIRKSNKHSYDDFGLLMIDREIETPLKNKVKAEVPFMNGSYDFSNMYGYDTYNERKLKYTFRLKGRSIQEINNKYTSIVNWLVNTCKEPLYDDLFKGFYFLAECEGEVDFKELKINKKYATFTVEFIAYPFKISTQYEGENLWDSFNFESDILQDTKFNVVSNLDVYIYNGSAISITPEVICSSPMLVTLGGFTYSFVAGNTKDYRFKLNKGNNAINIKGTGNIEFKFRKEVL